MSEVREIEIPYAPRIWAKKLHASFERWSALVLHRRAGKTTAILNHHQRAAMDDEWEMARLRHLLPNANPDFLAPLLKRRVYWHVMPQANQAKSVAWAILKEICEPIPGARANEAELYVRYPNGNSIHLKGADKPDSLRGPALSGLSLDEYSQIPEQTFGEVLSKALGDHLGYCIFSGTIKGKDQLFNIHASAKANPDWYAVWQDLDVSLATESGPTIAALQRALADDLKLVRDGVITQDWVDQEWYLSVDAAIQGAWYRKEMATAKEQGRITRVPWDPGLPVDTDWDLGMADAMSIVFSQSTRGGEVRIIDYYENEGEAFPHYIKVLREKPYTYGKHTPPHDITIKEMGSGKSRMEVARDLGLKFEWPETNPGVSAGIDAVRLLLSKCWFDEIKAARLIECLRNYRKTFNTRLGVYTGVPVHDQFSHGSDAMRVLGVRHRPPEAAYVESQHRPVQGGWMGV